MKNLILVVLAAAIGFGGAYMVVSQKNAAQLSALRAQLAKTSAPSAVPATDSPSQILQKLAVLNPNDVPNRQRAARQIIFYLESLVNAGNSAVKPISDFVAGGQDMDYVLEEKNVSGVTFWNWRPGQPIYSGLVLPPTLRLSLVDVLHYIGGADAENALVTMLKTTTHAVEVAYIGQLLEKIAPGKYTELASATAKKLLMASAPAANPGSKIDARSETYLYSMLNSRGDTSLVQTAESKILNQGHVDTETVEFLIKTLKQDAVPALALAYTNASATDKNYIANVTYSYIGSSDAADQIFRDWILNNTADMSSGSLSGRSRTTALAGLAGANYGLYSTDVPSDPVVILKRIGLLEDLDSQVTDPKLKQAIEQGIQNLRNIKLAK